MQQIKEVEHFGFILCLEGLPDDILIKPKKLRLGQNLEVSVGRAPRQVCSANWILGTNQFPFLIIMIQELGLLIP
jgi:hypothetical protein